jgi:dedicator of cytokinesis protein 3
MRSPTGSWIATAASRSHIASPTPGDPQPDGAQATSPVPNGRPARQDKKRLSLAFLTKGVLMGDADKPNHDQTDKHSIDDQDAASVSDSARSPSKEISRHRLSLSFLHTAPVTPNSPAPEALPAFSKSQNVSQSNLSQASLGRTPSQSTRPETSKSVKSESSKKGSSMKKRLSFMNISKKSSKNSVRGKQQDSLAEE